MALTWNEIRERSLAFSREWSDASNEDAEAKTFLMEFFRIFGVYNRKVNTFEYRVKKLDNHDGYIDMLWKQVILVEMKSRGRDLDKAYAQAREYLNGLAQIDLPQFVMVSDFARLRLYDLEQVQDENYSPLEFELKDLSKNIHHFGFLAGYQKRTYKEQDPVNVKAAELMGRLHDRMKQVGYRGHALEVYLVRLLFCLFAEDTGIFARQQFQDFIEQRTNEDGSDLAPKLQVLFQALDTPEADRFTNLDEHIAAFPYVNGRLFEENLQVASFDSKMRSALLACCHLDWSKISPAIFGSMFQSVMNPKERRNLGAHYTSEQNILKVIKSLFLDDLWSEFGRIKTNRRKLIDFHGKLRDLKFLDPACGCGNFLVIAYRELRLLEIAILKVLHSSDQRILNVDEIIWLDVDMMYGIEIEEFPARIAEVAMWLVDHQMNIQIGEEFGGYPKRIPLKKAANIYHGNALEVDWGKVVPIEQVSYIMGNPPFAGSRVMSKIQKAELKSVFGDASDIGELDFVCGWYVKAARLIQGTGIQVAFVSTNSIVQGLQTGILWSELLNKYSVKIHFAHRTFKWSNEARGKAAVYCVIIGFGVEERADKTIFDYDDVAGEPHAIQAKNINPYLLDSKNIWITKSSKPICKVPEMNFGNMPADGGELLFTEAEKAEFLRLEPKAKPYIRPLISAYEFLNGESRFCLWLEDIEPSTLRSLPHVLERVEKVRKIRQESARPQLADIPHLFAQITQPKDQPFILIPAHSSENRKYIPIGFFPKTAVSHNSCLIIANGTSYHFGVLTSKMHMAWVKTTCGRIKSDFRYSKDIVYNNFPWPDAPTNSQMQKIENAAQQILEVRAQYPDSSLADLYDPRSMPKPLSKAHSELDKAVDAAYRPHPFINDAKRMEFLFELYEKYTAGLFAGQTKKKK